MSNYTQGLIIDTFDSMLERMPFDKITVTALIRECNIGRNTFYYHYEDIYALLDYALTQWLGRHIEDNQQKKWQDVLKSILHGCQNNKNKIYHIFNSLSRDQLVQYVFEKTDSAISSHIMGFAELNKADLEKAQIIAEIVSYSVHGYFLRFLWNGMEDDVDDGVNKLVIVLEQLLESLKV